jgi:hypothetical protein
MKSMKTAACALCMASLCAQAAAPTLTSSAQVKRGEYLVKTSGCTDCHAPMKMGPHGPQTDLSRGLSGHPQDEVMPPAPPLKQPWMWMGSATNTAFAGPWGVTYAPNLTPDTETGIGKWAAKEFVQAMRTGKHAGVGRPIMPPMPWSTYRNFSDADLNAIFAYLKSRPAVKNRVPEYQPPQRQP